MIKVLILSFVLSSCVDKIKNQAMELLSEKKEAIQIPMPPLLEILKAEQKPVESIKNDEFSKLQKNEQLMYQGAFVQEVILATTRNKVSDAEYENWMNVLVQGGSREGIYHGLVLGDYYRRLEQESHNVADITVTFTQEFMAQFLAQSIEKKLIKKANIFSLKSIVGEKALDVVDKLSYKREHLANWYALLSVYFARKFPNLWKSEVRKSLDPTTHLLWASKMPLGHIKSEVLIKLHIVFNTLNRI